MRDQNEQRSDDDTPIEFSVSLRLKPKSVAMIKRFGDEFGLSSKGATISRILDELFCVDDDANALQ